MYNLSGDYMAQIYFATNLEFLRKRKGWTQLELASKLGVSESVIAHWEHGRRQPQTMEIVGKIADLFGVGADIIFKDLRLETNPKENELINNVRMLTPEEQDKVLAMIDLIKK